MGDGQLPDKALDRILHFVGVRTAVAGGLHGVCRKWRNAILSHEDWKRECERDDIDHIDRPDGVAVDWGAHFMSYAESQHTQGKVMAAVMHGKNIFMTGPGGVGKTVLIKVMADKLRAMSMRVCVAATTGMAATLIGGTTLHRWGGVGLAKEPARDLLRKMRRETRERWRQTDVLIIDEVSMLDPDTFEKFDEIARHLRSCHDELFGGIQIIASGDFLQLPPIKPDGQHRFVFQHPVWEKGIDKTFMFKHIYRTTDALFTEVLGRVRMADHTAEDVQILKTRLNAKIPEAEKLGILPTRMYSHRADVDGHNRTQLAALAGKPRTFEAKVRVQRVGAHHSAQNRYVLRFTRAENQAAQACPVAQKIQYKDGAQVMLVVNLDPDEGLVNGSRGVVTDAHHELGVEVRFLNGETRVIEPFRWSHDDARGDKGEAIKLTYDQMPLALAWAYTVHKSQGATLDAAIMDLGSRVFAAGMSYVSLSRVRSLKSMSLTALDASAIRADALVKSYYAYIERYGTHKGFRATVNRLVFPSTREMRSLVRALPAIKRRRDAAAAAAEEQQSRKRAAEDASDKTEDEPVDKRARTS
jgi:ATP-dependent DNA helicase PIF1